jgi:hypothetical protein
MSIVLQSSGGGSVTLEEAVTASNLTITVPAVTGTMLTTGNIPTGSVLQVINANYSTQVSSSSSTFADTGLTATITPTSSTSKILVIVQQNGTGKDSSNTWVNLKLQRSGSDIATIGAQIWQTNSTLNLYGGSASISYLDSPATTSATTYKTQYCSNQNTSLVYCQLGSSVSTITLMEIAA